VKRKPAFMAVHFSQTDAVQHALGPGTPEALVALEETDANLAIVVAAIRRSGAAADVTMIVTGDHGFLPLHTELAINVPLVEAGLITEAANGHPEWQAIVAPNRGLGSVYVREGASRGALVTRAREALTKYERRFPGRFRIVEREELDRWGADTDAAFGIEPFPGYVLDARLSLPFAQAHSRAAGHGYSPVMPGMETGLVLWGAGVRKGVRLPETRTLDVAPTIAKLLGLQLPQAEGQPIAGALK
jgi:predicted AlkP superfamily pyrophosphatase or phosphodiesterase